MLEELFSSSAGETLTVGGTLGILAVSLALGLLISGVYILTHKKEGYSGAFTITLIMVPAIISIIILLVGNSVARAFSLAGAFSLIRFRSAPGDPKDIAYIFSTVAIGLACGMGYLGYAVLFAVVLCGVMLALAKTGYGDPKDCAMVLRVTLPENLNFQGAFDDILDRYTSGWTVSQVKTTEFGALFEVTYNIVLRQHADQKEFIDELRSRNGNLKIAMTVKTSEYGVRG